MNTQRANRIRPLAAVALLISAWIPAAAQSQRPVVYQQALKAITAPATSATMPDIGQGMHLITVLFPTASATVSGLQIRIEASHDAALWVPITADITSAVYLSGLGAYAIERANGYYPFIRIRAAQTSATFPATIWYTGGTQPVGQISLIGGRFVPQPPSAAERVSWGLCSGSGCAVTSAPTPPFVVSRGGAIQRCYAAARTAPTGASLVFDVMRNGVSVFGASKLTIPAGQQSASTSTFNARAVSEGDWLDIAITQVGSSTAGQDVMVACIIQ